MSIGGQLRASREARGLSIDAVAHTTRVQPRILAAIERDDIRAVPPRPFGRGFVKAYAREMGLDGDLTTREYFAQFAPVVEPTAEPGPPPARSMQATRFWPIAVVSVGVAAGVVLAVALTRQRPAPERRSGVANVVGTSGSAAAADAVAAPKSTDAVAPAVPNTGSVTAAPDATAGVTVVLTATSPSWVTANADGRRAIFRTVTPGSPETVIAKREIVMRVGNAGALAWRINGRDAGPMGRQGQVRDVTITPATAGTIR